MDKKIQVIVDACCHVKDAHISGRSSCGKAACGVLIINEKGEEYEFGSYFGEKTVPEAEFNGLIFALEQAAAISRRDIEVWMDSELVVKWMTGEYRLKKEHIRLLFDEAKKKEQRFRSVQYFHHKRSTILGKRVDLLAKVEYEKHQ